MLGTYRLQDPNGRELAALVHDNRLIQANIRTTEELRKLWASPAAKDTLRQQNSRLELIPSEPENTDALECYLMEVDPDEPDLEPLEIDSRKRKRDSDESAKEVDQGKRRKGDLIIRIPQKCWMEQIVLDEATRRNAMPSSS
jgi:hypothetical protein